MQDLYIELAKWRRNIINQDIIEIYNKLLKEWINSLDNTNNSIDKTTNDLIMALQAYIKEHNLI